MDARLVREGIAPHDGLVGLDREAGQVADQAAGIADLLGVDAVAADLELGGTRSQRHDHLFERRVAGAFAETVDGDLHLSRPGLHSRQRVGCGKAEVVVAMDADDGAGAYPVDYFGGELAELGRDGIAHGVGDVDGGGAGIHDGLEDAQQVVVLGAAGVLGTELDLGIGAEALARVADPLHGRREGFLARHPQLVLKVDVAGGDEEVQVRFLCRQQCVDTTLGVAVLAARQAGDGDAPGLRGDALDGLEVAWRGGREAGLDDVDVQPDELPRDLDLLADGESGPRGLLAIAQGGVKDAYWYVGGHQASPLPLWGAAAPLVVACAWPAVTSTGSSHAICERRWAPTCSIWWS